MPNAMIAPMNDCTFIVVPVTHSAMTTPATMDGTIVNTMSGRRKVDSWPPAAGR